MNPHNQQQANATAVDRELRQAIAQRRLVRFMFKNCLRIAEPHDYGVRRGAVDLLCYQVGGQSGSGRIPGWRWTNPGEISQLEILDETFPGARPAPSGQHTEWDEIYASVSRPRTRAR